jgi:hypothetical protein
MTVPGAASSQTEPITAPLSGHCFSWPVSLLLHYFIAVVGGMIVGFLPEAALSRLYYNTGLEPYSPAIALTALLLGYFVSVYIGDGRAAIHVWVLGLLWMIFGIYGTMTYWSASWSPERTRWDYMLANLFGATLKCSGTECLYELLYTTPFTAWLPIQLAHTSGNVAI